MDVHHIPYSEPFDRLRCFDLYRPQQSPALNASDDDKALPLSPVGWIPDNYVADTVICFIHGGAWRAEDKALHSNLARNLTDASHFPVLVPNYRLSPTVTHPTHTYDILQFLEFITRELACKNVYLLGHSCAAHMLSTIFLDAPDLAVPSTTVLAATKAVILSEGIYDITLLLRSFPDYLEWFIADAFPSTPYPNVNTFKPRPGSEHIRWLVLHSKADTLVDEVQSEAMYQHLSSHFSSVSKDFHTLKNAHDDVLSAPEYIHLVLSMIQ